MFESVDLPAPFSPSRAWTSPSTASNSTPSFATTPGNRLVMPLSETAADIEVLGGRGPMASPAPEVVVLALRASDDALDEPVDRVELVHGQPLAGLDPQLPALVVERTGELVPLAADDQG